MKTKMFLSFFLAAAVVFSSCGQNELTRDQLKTQTDTISYAIGVTFGSSLLMSGIEDINPQAVALAIQELFDGDTTAINPEEANMMLNDYFGKLQFGDNIEEGEEFLAENRLKEGVITTDSGIQYEVIEMGDGPQPSADDEVVVHYKGTLIDGTQFDSSYERGEPAQFQLNQVIPGWTEALQLMSVGSKWRIYIPQELAYGANPRQGGVIEPYMMLIFEIELLDIISE
ncbi:MAG: FKBP-type peptidyl-prolyl cis-trans isomerase [Bacteroidales bacterium]